MAKPAKPLHIANRYLDRYNAQRIGWDTLIQKGRKLPGSQQGLRQHLGQVGPGLQPELEAGALHLPGPAPGQ